MDPESQISKKASDTEKRIFWNLHISDNTRLSLLTGREKKKKPSGLFSRYGVRKGIPMCPYTPERILALNSTWERITERDRGRWQIWFGYTAGWPGRKEYFPLPSASLQHVTPIKLKHILNCLLSEALSSKVIFRRSAAAPAGSEQLSSPAPCACLQQPH